MKYIKLTIALLLSITFSISCKKAIPEDLGKTLLFKENISNVKKGEPVSVTFGDDNVTAKIDWTISPTTNSTIKTIANNATITFDEAGTYTITATMGNVYSIYNIMVDDINYTPDFGTNSTMVAPKFFNIRPNEPVTFTAYNTTNGIIGCTAFPATGVQISVNNNKKTATLIFDNIGFYAIYINDGLVNYTRRSIIVDSPNTNISLQNTDFFLGDKLQLTPSLQAGKIVISAQTSRKYNCNNDIILSSSISSLPNEYQIDYVGVSTSHTTCSVRNVATCVNNLKPVKVGIHPFIISFQNKTFKGTIALTATGKYTFDWKDNSEISIFPTTL
jgi:plastocyanin